MNHRRAVMAAALVALPLICAVIFLADNAPRDWSLHWHQPQTLIAQSGEGAYDAVATSRGWDVLWQDAGNHMLLSHFDSAGHRITADIHLAGAPVSLSLARVGAEDVAVWRQDYNGGSLLRSAILRPGAAPVYRTLAHGRWPLEHPQAFAEGQRVGVVFSWQRGPFNVYLSTINSTGGASAPVRLTHVAGYAYEPHAVYQDGQIHLVYFDECCGEEAFYLDWARYTPAGRLLAAPVRLDTVTTIGQGGANGGSNGTVPDQWGLDVQTDGSRIWTAWSSDGGISVAAWRGTRLAFKHMVLETPPPAVLAVPAARNERDVVWRQETAGSNVLATLPLTATGLPAGAGDRVVYEPGIDDQPVAASRGGAPITLWQNGNSIEESGYTPKTLSAPNLPTRLGLGLGNPAGNFILLIGGSLAIGALITVGNILLILVVTVAYALTLRRIEGGWKLAVFAAALGLLLYSLLVWLNAPFPYVVALGALSTVSGVIAAGGAVLFVLLLSRSFLRGVDEVYRAGALVLAAVYFVAFLHALTVVQGQLGQV